MLKQAYLQRRGSYAALPDLSPHVPPLPGGWVSQATVLQLMITLAETNPQQFNCVVLAGMLRLSLLLAIPNASPS
jgi:hypothetical protein